MCGADAAIVNEHTFLPGSPPRVRSRPRCCRTVHPPGRITSACAEQTPGHSNLPREARDHLRVCGADYSHVRKTLDEYGSPPRVRSRPHDGVEHAHAEGITSACAEQTLAQRCQNRSDWDHLRVCGADRGFLIPETSGGGSPPRVRSRHVHVRVGFGWRGITSACAEQTVWDELWHLPQGDHLRVCGADKAKVEQLENEKGSPPRVRSRRCSGGQGKDRGGITSACAEQTNGGCAGPSAAGDHLRVCGADQRVRVKRHGERGSPPRVRSRLSLRSIQATSLRITSACAEQTWRDRTMTRRHRDHLRVCGADRMVVLSVTRPAGSPPRVRSRQDA